MRIIGDTNIYHWSEIQDSFQGADIFLGNGFSININEALNYRSLFDTFLTYLKPTEQANFKKFNSTNFEGIQGKLTDAIEVNAIFGNAGLEIEMAIQQLKSGLLMAIKDLHPNFSTIDQQTVYHLSQKFDWFEDIYTTNYDIFLYHIVLTTMDRFKRGGTIKRYQDFFRKNGSDLQFIAESIKAFKNIYYLHGALFLNNELGRITKIKRGSKTDELLELIRLKIHLGNLPLFVSEGSAKLKEETIAKNLYLSFCRSAFRSNRNRLVIHGFSFSNFDDHLINDLNRSRRKLAIGLYLSGLNDTQIVRKVRTIAKKLYNYPLKELRYFDSRTLF